MSIGKNSLARAAAATTSRTVTETAKNPGSLRQVAVESILPLRGKKVTASVTDALVASVARYGVLEPLLLAQTGPEELRLLSGGRRLCAARQAGLATVPAVILDMTAAEAAQAQKELRKFVAAEPPASVTATEVTAVGQAMPDWLL